MPSLCTLLVATALAQPDAGVAGFLTSLPVAQGKVAVAGLEAPVRVSRDSLGIPVLEGSSEGDLAVALGFVHAQERFFQMDAARRLAAGRLAEIVGPPMVESDRHYRHYRFEDVARRVVAGLPAPHARKIDLYVQGVNAGLAALASPPPEYAFLGVEPSPWRAEDCILVLLAMFDALHFDTWQEMALGVMAATLPPELYAFLTPVDTRFESPLLGGDEYAPAPVPGPEIVDLRRRGAQALPADLVEAPFPAAGSNNWAVAGGRAAHGGAILANDPHLPVTAPGLWFRAEFERDGRRSAGLTLPGAPGLAIGSTGRLAWGFTNTMGDFQDLVVVEVDPADPGRYRTPEGWEPFEEIEETIAVLGAEPVALALRRTRWGIVTDEDHLGRPLVLKWTALDPALINLAQMDLSEAATLEAAIDIARRWRGPSQNVLLADGSGRIAWTLSGAFPRRVGFDGTVPVSWAAPGVGWEGLLPEEDRPLLVDPPDGVLYTANNRTVGTAWSRRLGHTWDLGARARRIGSLLRAGERLSERDLLAMQLDTRVELFDFYRDLVVEAGARAPRGLLGQARLVALEWNGTADADQPALRLLHHFRRALFSEVTGPLVAPCRDADPRFAYRWFRGEEPVRRILEERPAHLLPPGYDDWDDLVATTLERVAESLAEKGGERGLLLPWGEENLTNVQHPLAAGDHALRALLSMPEQPQAGHFYAVRVATRSFGASARFVVSPGREDLGLLHIPAGQSGHPLSPHFRDSHPAWLEGLPTPLRAGEAQAVLVLRPTS